MTHLLIQCEGETEFRVLKQFLQPFWSQRFSSVEINQYDGNGDLKAHFATDAKLQLIRKPDSSVLCLVDLYEEPFEIYQSGQMTSQEGFLTVQKHMYSLIDNRLHPRFGAFPVVMELETWLLADTTVMSHLGQKPHPEPEIVEHPADYLKDLYRAKSSGYSKVIDGLNLFSRGSAKRVYDDNCPHFKLMINWLVEGPKPANKQSDSIRLKLEAWEQKRSELQAHLEELDRQLENDPSDENMDAYEAAEKVLDDFVKSRDDIFKRH